MNPARLRSFATAVAAWDWLPALAFTLLPALIVRGKWLVVAADATSLWGGYTVGDTRTWWKAVCVVGIAAWMLCVALCRPRLRRKKLLALCALAAAGVLASTLLSPFPQTRWIGYTTTHEGAFVLWSYLAALWYTAGMESAPARRRVLRAAAVVAGVNILLGIAAGLGHDFWQSALGARVIGFPAEMIRHTFAGTTYASGTAYQPNHYGMLMATLGALALGMTFAETKRGWKILWGAVFVLSAVALLFSQSRAGALTLAGLTACAAAAKARTLRRTKLPAGSGAIALALAAALCAAIFLFGGAAEKLAGRMGEIFLPPAAPENVQPETFTRNGRTFAVDQTNSNLRLLAHPANTPLSVYTPNGWEGFLGGRGYIWTRSLEKWRERPLLGWGPGSLALVFPNDDLPNKRRYSFGEDTDKGHSVIVTFLVQGGAVGAILYALPFGYALLCAMQRAARRRFLLRSPLLLGMAAYCICALTNDSTAGVTPLFCVIAGLAAAEAEDAKGEGEDRL